MNAEARTLSSRQIDELQARFLRILPRIELHAKVSSRGISCPQKREDFLAEVIAMSWRWFVRLVTVQGKKPENFVSVLGTFAVKAVRAGRRLCGQLKPRDVLSARAQAKHGFGVCKLPDFSTLNVNPLAEALTDNTQSAVPDQVQFRCDFPDWLGTHTERNRKIVVEMAQGERTKALARRCKLSPARVSQLRRELADSWDLFTNDEPVAAVAS